MSCAHKNAVFVAVYGNGPFRDAVEVTAAYVLEKYGIVLSQGEKMELIAKAARQANPCREVCRCESQAAHYDAAITEMYDRHGMYTVSETTPNYVGKLVYAQSGDTWGSGEFVIISQNGTDLEGIPFVPDYEGTTIKLIHLQPRPSTSKDGKANPAWTITRVNSDRSLIVDFSKKLRSFGENIPVRPNWVKSVYTKAVAHADMIDRLLKEIERDREITERLTEAISRKHPSFFTLTGRKRN